MFENRVLRRISEPKREEITGEWRTMRSFIFCTHPQIFWADQVKENEVGGACGTQGRGKESVQDFGGKARRK
jgi:hypothetical protein